MFLISKCRADWDLGLCTTSVLALEERMRDGKIWKKTCFDAGKIGFCHCVSVLQAQVPKLCTDLDLSLLYILILGTYCKFARKIDFLALDVYCPAGQSAFRRSRPQQIGWGNQIFEISRRLIAQNSQIPNPTLTQCFPNMPLFARLNSFFNYFFLGLAKTFIHWVVNSCTGELNFVQIHIVLIFCSFLWYYHASFLRSRNTPFSARWFTAHKKRTLRPSRFCIFPSLVRYDHRWWSP